MTIQPHETSPDYARQLTDRIRVAVEGTWQLIVEAYQSRAWAALGYSSWDDYCTREFGTSRLKLPREERAEQVSSLREAGLSLRAIQSATGHDVKTIRKDLSGVGNSHTPPQPKSDAELLAGAEWSPEAVEPEPRFTDEPGRVQPVTQTVTGMDGKQYTRPEPKPEPQKSRRNPLPDQARTAGWEVRKSVERIERIMEDDRFNRNKEEVAAHLRGHLQYAIETLQTTLDHLN